MARRKDKGATGTEEKVGCIAGSSVTGKSREEIVGRRRVLKQLTKVLLERAEEQHIVSAFMIAFSLMSSQKSMSRAALRFNRTHGTFGTCIRCKPSAPYIPPWDWGVIPATVTFRVSRMREEQNVAGRNNMYRLRFAPMAQTERNASVEVVSAAEGCQRTR